jgi:Protein of unknown function TPD sequence-motif
MIHRTREDDLPTREQLDSELAATTSRQSLARTSHNQHGNSNNNNNHHHRNNNHSNNNYAADNHRHSSHNRRNDGEHYSKRPRQDRSYSRNGHHNSQRSHSNDANNRQGDRNHHHHNQHHHPHDNHRQHSHQNKRQQSPEEPLNVQDNHDNNSIGNTQFEQDIAHTSESSSFDTSTRTLVWPCPASHVPIKTEQAAKDVLVRWDNERGLLLRQPAFRIQQVQSFCKNKPIAFEQACSLRRHLLKMREPYKTIEQLGLGSDTNVRESARLFEEAVANHLQTLRVDYWSEDDLKRHCFETGQPCVATPDFYFDRPIKLQTRSCTTSIHWLEVKMFYGASIVPNDDNASAVGSLTKIAKKYTSAYGRGAFLFMYGCGDVLARYLESLGVVVLDCSGGFVDLEPVREHQRTWCGNADGMILC